MNLSDLRVFAEVARQKSFAGAARTLNQTPSMVTRAVAALETALGARLLQRNTRHVSLTEGGAMFLAQAEMLLAEFDMAADTLRSGTGEIRGTVRITASVAFGQTVLMPLLKRLHALHPGLELELQLTDAVIDLVEQRIDIALRLGPTIDSSLIGQRLRPIRYHVVASPEYLRVHGKPIQPADLANRDCVRFPLPGFRTQWQFRDVGGVEQIVPIGGWLVASTALALRQAALDGLGPALLADWLVGDDLRAGTLQDLFPRFEATATHFDSGIWLLYSSREHVPMRVRAVLEFLRQSIGVGSEGTLRHNEEGGH